MRRYGRGYRDVRFANEQWVREVGKVVDSLKPQVGNMSTLINKAYAAASTCQTLYKRGDYNGAKKKAAEATQLLWDVHSLIQGTVGSFGFASRLPEKIEQVENS